MCENLEAFFDAFFPQSFVNKTLPIFSSSFDNAGNMFYVLQAKCLLFWWYAQTWNILWKQIVKKRENEEEENVEHNKSCS